MPPWVLCAADSGLPVRIGVGDLWGYPCGQTCTYPTWYHGQCAHTALTVLLLYGAKRILSWEPKRAKLPWTPNGLVSYGPHGLHMGFHTQKTHMKYPKGQNCSRPCVLPGAHRINVNSPCPTQPHVWQTGGWYWHRGHSGSSAGGYRALSCMCFCS